MARTLGVDCVGSRTARITHSVASNAGLTGDPLTALEHEVIATLVRHDHPLTEAFRAQLEACRIKSRELTGVGFFTRLVVPQRLAVVGLGRLVLSEVAAELDGVQHGAGFVLFIEDGMLDLLEGFTYDEPWPDRVERFAVRSLTPHDLEAVEAGYRRVTRAAQS